MSDKRKPNFFILGAPKCGTTSVAYWLRDHDNVFVSDPKEPHYFNTDSDFHDVFSLDQYEALFDTASDRHRAVGEASVWYLASDDAVGNILEYQPDARFIVCLRNPTEASPSQHDQMVFSGDENLLSFEAAWHAQERRASGRLKLPPTCVDVKHLLYGPSFCYGSLIEKLYRRVDKDRVCVILMDDITTDPGAVYRRILKHVGVEDDGRREFPLSNPAKERKSMLLRRLNRYFTIIKYRLGITGGTGLGKSIDRWNEIVRPRQPLQAGLKQELVEYFSADIDLLQDLLGRDLQHWKQ